MDFEFLKDIDQQATLAINGSESLFWDNIMYTVTNTFSWSLVLIALFIIIFKNNKPKDAFLVIIAMALLIFVADRICSGFVKPTVARWRPTQDPQIMYLVDVVNNYRGGRFGFFSGHACNTFCVAMFLSLLFRYSKLTVVLFLWAATTTFTRLYLGVHYVGDVTVGCIIGLLLGYIFHFIYHRIQIKMGLKRFISEQFTSSGYLKSDMEAFMTIIFFNYICVVLFALSRGIM